MREPIETFITANLVHMPLTVDTFVSLSKILIHTNAQFVSHLKVRKYGRQNYVS